MSRWIPITVLAVSVSLAAVGLFAQQPSTDSGSGDRKVVSRVLPNYPEMARTLRLSGSVRVEVTVLPNGNVKSLEVKGGHPVLAIAAAEAVRKWRWVPAKTETKEPVTVKFESENQ